MHKFAEEKLIKMFKESLEELKQSGKKQLSIAIFSHGNLYPIYTDNRIEQS